MVQVVLFGWLLIVAALAAADKDSALEQADTVEQAAKPDKRNPAVKADKAVKPDRQDSVAKATKAPIPPLDPQSAYELLLRERDHLEWQKKVLEWEEGLAEASLQDSAAYLVVDLNRQVIMAKLGGVPMRDAPILWRYERSGQPRVSGIFQVAERVVEPPFGEGADSVQALPQLAVKAVKADSGTTDTATALPRGPAPRHYDPQRRFGISLKGGPDLWLATLPPAQSRRDSLEIRMRIWLRDFPAVVQHRQSIYLFLSPADSYWIYAMAVWGARVLVIPPS